MGLHDIRPDRPNPESSTPASMRECYVEIALGSPHATGVMSRSKWSRGRAAVAATPPGLCSSSGLLRHGTEGGGHGRHGDRVRGDGLSGDAVSCNSGGPGCRCRPTGCRRCDSTRGGCRRCRSYPRVSPGWSRSGLPPTGHDNRKPARSRQDPRQGLYARWVCLAQVACDHCSAQSPGVRMRDVAAKTGSPGHFVLLAPW